jgi:endonuclease-3
MNRREVLEIHKALAGVYGPPPRIGRGNPLDQLVETILSQNTTDKNSHRAYLSLRGKFPTWSAVAKAPSSAIEAQIHQGGLAQIKSWRIKQVLRIIQKREGWLSLACLTRMSDTESIEYLTSLPGVGIKTANCVLLFSLGRPVMPVDTHVNRVTRRLGWIDQNMPIDKVGATIQKIVPPKLMLDVHIYLVWHGRRICKAGRPRCSACVIRSHCRFYRRTVDADGRLVYYSPRFSKKRNSA